MNITVENVKKYYGTSENRNLVLNNLSVEIPEKKITVILGPSGSGKSTLLNIIGGLDTADSGKVLVDGKNIVNYNTKQLSKYRREYLGFVFQFYNLVPNLTVKENIQTAEYLTDNPLDIDELMDNLGILEHQRKYPSQLSGGQQQRCSIARALTKNPKILLCDEPTGALDYKSSKETLVLFEKVNQQYGTTIIMVTHNEAIQQMAHKIIKVKDGVATEEYNDKIIPACEIGW